MRLNYISLADDTGYAFAGRRYLELLQAAGVDVCAVPMLPASDLDTNQGTTRSIRMRPPSSTPFLSTTHLVRKLRSVANFAPRIGITVWETARPPLHWPALLDTLDAPIVPTEWNRRVFSEAGVSVPIHVLPHASEFEGRLLDKRMSTA